MEVGRVALGAAAAILDETGRILLVRHSYGRQNWKLPGGVAKPGESPEITAMREVAEETALRIAHQRCRVDVDIVPAEREQLPLP